MRGKENPVMFFLWAVLLFFVPAVGWAACTAPVANVVDCGAVGDGAADDTQALQTALDLFGKDSDKSGVIHFPIGTYKITQTLFYEGASHLGLRMSGDLGGTRGPTGSLIRWAGPVGGTMFYVSGLNGGLFENFELNGSNRAAVGLHLDAVNVEVPGSAGSAGNVLRRLTIGGIVGADSTAILIGHTTVGYQSQVSEIDMYDLILVGDYAGSSYYGIRTLTSGNVKDFRLTGGIIGGFRYGIDWKHSSGIFVVTGLTMAKMSVADFRLSAGNLHLNSVESEGSNTRFVEGTTGANPGSLVITNCSWQSAAPPDDVIISYSGHILLQGNTFNNTRTETSYPKIQVSGGPLITDPWATGITSLGNWYQRAPVDSGPFVDWADRPLLDRAGGFYTGKAVSVTSLGDYGGTGGAMYHLRNWLPLDALTR